MPMIGLVCVAIFIMSVTSFCVCSVSAVEESVRKEQRESTDGLVCVQGVSSGGECEKRAV